MRRGVTLTILSLHDDGDIDATIQFFPLDGQSSDWIAKETDGPLVLVQRPPVENSKSGYNLEALSIEDLLQRKEILEIQNWNLNL